MKEASPFEGYSPSVAAEMLAEELKLSAQQKESVCHVLNETSEDPILVVRINFNWINVFGQALANQILDAIATFNMPVGQRLDDEARHLCFHFANGAEVNACRRHIMNTPAFSNAFCPSPDAIALMTRLNGNFQGNREPLGFCSLVNKIGVRSSDILGFDFFYF